MKKLILVSAFAFLALIVSAGVLGAQTSPDNPKFTILIAADKPEVALGSDIVIIITTTNTSEEPIRVSFGYHGNMPDGYQFDMQDEQGTLVAKFGPRYRQLPNGNNFRLPDRPAGSMRWGDLMPGKKMEIRAKLSDDYNFDHPGKYKIRVWKPATPGTPELPELNRVYSNTITITVLPAESKLPEDQPPAQK